MTATGAMPFRVYGHASMIRQHTLLRNGAAFSICARAKRLNTNRNPEERRDVGLGDRGLLHGG